MQPFVIVAEMAELTPRGVQLWGVPIGVELASSSEDAAFFAARRWPYHSLSTPVAWPDCDAKVRLAALQAERMSILD